MKFAQSHPILAYPRFHLIALQSMNRHDCLQHLLLYFASETRKALLLQFQFLLQIFILFPKNLLSTGIRFVGVRGKRLLMVCIRVWIKKRIGGI